MQERSQLENSINNYSDLSNSLEEILELIDLYNEDNEETDNFDEDILSSLMWMMCCQFGRLKWKNNKKKCHFLIIWRFLDGI